MKKIVALVLSLVMVLGLATTAMAAADTKYEGLYYKTTTEAGVKDDAKATNLEFHKAVAPKDQDKDGALDVKGEVACYFVTAYSKYPFVEVKTLADADVVIYTDADAENVYMYLAKLEYKTAKYWPGVVTTNFGTACGQYTNDEDAGYDDEATYYVAQKTLYVGVEDAALASEQLLVDGELVLVAKATGIDKNAHKPVYTKNDKGVITAIKCSACGVVAVEAPNYASIPEGAVAVDQVNTLWYWTAAVEAPEAGDKVTSADTFDAGIAMYVGMSVMAAAGSAVVLKKKD